MALSSGTCEDPICGDQNCAQHGKAITSCCIDHASGSDLVSSLKCCGSEVRGNWLSKSWECLSYLVKKKNFSSAAVLHALIQECELISRRHGEKFSEGVANNLISQWSKLSQFADLEMNIHYACTNLNFNRAHVLHEELTKLRDEESKRILEDIQVEHDDDLHSSTTADKLESSVVLKNLQDVDKFIISVTQLLRRIEKGDTSLDNHPDVYISKWNNIISFTTITASSTTTSPSTSSSSGADMNLNDVPSSYLDDVEEDKNLTMTKTSTTTRDQVDVSTAPSRRFTTDSVVASGPSSKGRYYDRPMPVIKYNSSISSKEHSGSSSSYTPTLKKVGSDSNLINSSKSRSSSVYSRYNSHSPPSSSPSTSVPTSRAASRMKGITSAHSPPRGSSTSSSRLTRKSANHITSSSSSSSTSTTGGGGSHTPLRQLNSRRYNRGYQSVDSVMGLNSSSTTPSSSRNMTPAGKRTFVRDRTNSMGSDTSLSLTPDRRKLRGKESARRSRATGGGLSRNGSMNSLLNNKSSGSNRRNSNGTEDGDGEEEEKSMLSASMREQIQRLAELTLLSEEHMRIFSSELKGEGVGGRGGKEETTFEEDEYGGRLIGTNVLSGVGEEEYDNDDDDDDDDETAPHRGPGSIKKASMSKRSSHNNTGRNSANNMTKKKNTTTAKSMRMSEFTLIDNVNEDLHGHVVGSTSPPDKLKLKLKKNDGRQGKANSSSPPILSAPKDVYRKFGEHGDYDDDDDDDNNNNNNKNNNRTPPPNKTTEEGSRRHRGSLSMQEFRSSVDDVIGPQPKSDVSILEGELFKDDMDSIYKEDSYHIELDLKSQFDENVSVIDERSLEDASLG
jgi:hypothetical protein